MPSLIALIHFSGEAFCLTQPIGGLLVNIEGLFDVCQLCYISHLFFSHTKIAFLCVDYFCWLCSSKLVLGFHVVFLWPLSVEELWNNHLLTYLQKCLTPNTTATNAFRLIGCRVSAECVLSIAVWRQASSRRSSDHATCASREFTHICSRSTQPGHSFAGRQNESKNACCLTPSCSLSTHLSRIVFIAFCFMAIYSWAFRSHHIYTFRSVAFFHLFISGNNIHLAFFQFLSRNSPSVVWNNICIQEATFFIAVKLFNS